MYALLLPRIDFQRTPVTLSLMAVIIALEAFGLIDPDSRNYFYNKWLGVLPTIWYGELWRPFTTTLLHGGFLHAAFNVYILALFGAALENWLGPWRTLLLFVFLAFVSTLPQYIVTNFDTEPNKQRGIVGFSGVNYGLFGLLLIGRRYRPEFNLVCNQATVQMMIAWFFLCILLTNLGMLPVANIAHGAGLLFGVLIGQTIFSYRQRLMWAAITAAASLLVLTTLFYCPGHKSYEEIRKRQQRQSFVTLVGSDRIHAVPRSRRNAFIQSELRFPVNDIRIVT